jgi:hypothetical protein
MKLGMRAIAAGEILILRFKFLTANFLSYADWFYFVEVLRASSNETRNTFIT